MPNPENKKIPRSVQLLGWVSYFTDVSSEMIFSLLPVFLTLSLGAGSAALGIIEGISETTSSLLKIFSGNLSDRFEKKKPFVIAGYSISTTMRASIGFATSWTTILLLRFGDRVGKGIRTAPRDALIALEVDTHSRGNAYGFHRMMDHAGAVTGSLISALLIWLMPNQYRKIFLFAAIPGFIACAIALCKIGRAHV